MQPATRARVGYDARFSLGEYRGMGRYLRRLIRPIQDQAIGFCAEGEHDAALRLDAAGPRFYPAWEQLSLPRQAANAGVEFLLAPYNTAPLRVPKHVRLILVVHDLIFMRSTREIPLSRSQYQNFGRLYRRAVVPMAVRRADQIICVSEYTRKELRSRLGVPDEKISVIPNTIDASWFEIVRPQSPKDYVLCVSGEAPSKNLELGLRGFSEYCRIARDHSTTLRVIGVKRSHHAGFQQIAANCGIATQVEFLGFVSDFELQQLYAQARAFFLPSRDEGFGIPLLESLAAGTPAVVSNASSLPEVGGEAALYFHSQAAHEMADQLRTVLVNPNLQRVMSQRGRDRALAYHPDLVDANISGFWSEILEQA